jgi:U4/U6.U5 tri-snRNP-associated protein 1
LTRGLVHAEDELQNVDLAEAEADHRRHELKTKRRDYTGYDDEEFAEDAVAGVRRAVLAKYDEDINGPQQMVCSCVNFSNPVADFRAIRDSV